MNSSHKKVKKRKSNKTNVELNDNHTEESNNDGVDKIPTEDTADEKVAVKNIDIRSDDDEKEDASEGAKKKRKKHKKKKPVGEDAVKKPGEKSNRQLKREKEALRQAEMMATNQLQAMKEAHEYLQQWKSDKANWKFMKTKQIWLFKHKFDEEMVPGDLWDVFLEYFSSAVGNVKKHLIEDSNTEIAKMEQWVEKNENADKDKEEDNEEKTQDKPCELSYERARSIIQNIQE